MPAYFDTGFSVRRPAWHGLGNVLDDYPDDWDDARKSAGLDWEPQEVPLYHVVPLRVGELIPAGAHFPGDVSVDEVGRAIAAEAGDCFVKVEGHKAVRRSDNLSVLACPTADYTPITHVEMGELVEAFCNEAPGALKFETAGSIQGGRKVWALAYLDEPFTVPGDDSETYPFAAFLNAHDGTMAARVMPTSVRIVCWNTWSAAYEASERTGAYATIRHTGDTAQRLEDAKATLASVRTEAKVWQAEATELASIRIDDAVVSTFLSEHFIPVPEDATDRARAMRENRQADFMALYNESPTVAPLPDTAYKLTQAMGEYLDHLRPFRSRDTYLSRTMLRPEQVKGDMIRVIRELATA